MAGDVSRVTLTQRMYPVFYKMYPVFYKVLDLEFNGLKDTGVPGSVLPILARS